MRRGTKEIRKVFTGSREYYVYDLDKDFFGKSKRIYAATEGELKEKIAAAEAERTAVLETYRPVGKKLSDYVRFYFKCAVTQEAIPTIKKLTTLFDNAVFDSPIDKNIDEITQEDMQKFYNTIVLKFEQVNIDKITDVLKKTFTLAKEAGITCQFNLSDIRKTVPAAGTVSTAYIMSPKELESLLSFCIAEDCVKYGVNELVAIFTMLTGFRFQDINTMKAKDINLEEKTATIDKKKYPLSDQCVSWIESQIEIGRLPECREENDRLLFLNSYGNPLTMQSVHSTIRNITRVCGLPKGITTKTIRKAFIVSELENGTKPKEIKAFQQSAVAWQRVQALKSTVPYTTALHFVHCSQHHSTWFVHGSENCERCQNIFRQ